MKRKERKREGKKKKNLRSNVFSTYTHVSRNWNYVARHIDVPSWSGFPDSNNCHVISYNDSRVYRECHSSVSRPNKLNGNLSSRRSNKSNCRDQASYINEPCLHFYKRSNIARKLYSLHANAARNAFPTPFYRTQKYPHLFKRYQRNELRRARRD